MALGGATCSLDSFRFSDQLQNRRIDSLQSARSHLTKCNAVLKYSTFKTFDNHRPESDAQLERLPDSPGKVINAEPPSCSASPRVKRAVPVFKFSIPASKWQRPRLPTAQPPREDHPPSAAFVHPLKGKRRRVEQIAGDVAPAVMELMRLAPDTDATMLLRTAQLKDDDLSHLLVLLDQLPVDELNKRFAAAVCRWMHQAEHLTGLEGGLLVSLLQKCGQPGDAMAVFEAMDEAQMKKGHYSYHGALRACAEAGLPGRAVDIAERMQTELGLPWKGSVYSSLIAACANAGQLQEALSWHGKMRSAEARGSAEAYGALISAAADAEQWQTLMWAMQEMCEDGVVGAVRAIEWRDAAQGDAGGGRPRNYAALIAGCAAEGEFGRAIALHEEMRRRQDRGGRVARRVLAHCAVLRVCLRGGQHDDARRIFTELRDAGEPLDGVMYGAFLLACLSHGDVKAAWQALCDLQDEELHVEAEVCCTLIRALGGAGQWSRVLQVYELLEREGAAGAAAHAALVEAAAECGQTEYVFDFLGERKVDLAAEVYAAAIRGFVRAKLPEHAFAAMAAMDEAGVSGSHSSHLAVLELCAAEGLDGRALDELEAMRGNSIEAGGAAYAALVGAFIKAGKLDDTLDLLAVLPPDAEVYTAVMQRFADAALPEHALATAAAMYHRGLKADNAACLKVIDAYAKIGEWERADDVRQLMTWPKLPKYRNALDVLHEGLCAAGLWRQGCRIIRMMRRRHIDNGHRECDRIMPHQYNMLLRACCAAGEADRAMSFFTLMGRGVNGERGARTPTTYIYMIKMHGVLGELEKAMGVFEISQKDSISADAMSNVYSAMIGACALCGHWESAMVVFDSMRDKGVAQTALVYIAAMVACGNGGRWELALQLLQEVQEQDDLRLDTALCNAAINACLSGAQWESALSVLQLMKQEGVERDTKTYAALISACRTAGEYDIGLALLEEMEVAGIRKDTDSYTTLLDDCGQAGDWARAAEVMQLIEQDAERGEIDGCVDSK
ncbi:hypothetical protein CYMTET_11513 [Cymbomonas tetramitiformis]|uniref:Pentacotripeptide-repeat region of PRORP domain-containing protein n=1 Tax=Cymbomonas tetramitiformis TaxID=36881 RepID=A0AAE0GMI6_9CHLO|nr:hypothetical protein CYMTET_11513 [Cymbomonas tetramitiformis]